MRIRTATLDDIPTILDQRVKMLRSIGCEHPDVLARSERVSRAYFEEAIAAGRYHGILAETEDGRIVGGGGVVIVPWPGGLRRRQPRRAWILNVYVEDDFRRRGVAGAIMKNLIEWCRAQGFDSVSLHATKQGRPLYERLGFQTTDEMSLNLD